MSLTHQVSLSGCFVTMHRYIHATDMMCSDLNKDTMTQEHVSVIPPILAFCYGRRVSVTSNSSSRDIFCRRQQDLKISELFAYRIL